MKSRAIVSVAVGANYKPYGARLSQSVKKWDQNSDFILWKDWPPNSPPHQSVHYAFKAYAIKNAVERGYKKVMWLDAGCEVIANPEPIWGQVETNGVYVVHGDHILGEWISDQALSHFGVTRDWAMDYRLCGGAIVGLNLSHPKADAFYRKWLEIAKTPLMMCSHSEWDPKAMRSVIMSDGPKHIVYSNDPRCKGHRSDETCFSVMARIIGIETTYVGKWNEMIRSGYDIPAK